MASSDFTDLRLECIIYNQVIIRWAYAGSGTISIWRSTAGGSYELVVDDLDAATILYTDSGLTADTHYDYKLSDDDGSTFSDPEGIHTQLSDVTISDRNNAAALLPQFVTEEDVNAQNVDYLAQAIRDGIQNQTTSTDRCVVCPEDGHVILDCSTGCFSFRVGLTEEENEINSITVIGCTVCPDVEFLIPANVTAGICGWPSNCYYTGDECFQSPITGPKIATTDGGSTKTTPAGGGGGGGSGCFCEHTEPFNIQCCEDDNICELECEGKQSITLKACGGVAPYHWEVSGNVRLSSTSGESVIVSVASGGSGDNPDVEGIGCIDVVVDYAYFNSFTCGGVGPSARITDYSINLIATNRYECDDTMFALSFDYLTRGVSTMTLTYSKTCIQELFGGGPNSYTNHLTGFNSSSNSGPWDQSNLNFTAHWVPTAADGATYDFSVSLPQTDTAIPPNTAHVQIPAGKMDVRTQAMIEDGCPSCLDECNLDDVMISVTDGLGRTATIAGIPI